MKRLLCSALLLLLVGQAQAAGCKEIFVKFYYPNGGDNSWSLRGSGDYTDTTGTVRFFQANGAWTITGPGGTTWTRTGNPCDAGGGFVNTVPAAVNPIRVEVTESQ